MDIMAFSVLLERYIFEIHKVQEGTFHTLWCSYDFYYMSKGTNSMFYCENYYISYINLTIPKHER